MSQVRKTRKSIFYNSCATVACTFPIENIMHVVWQPTYIFSTDSGIHLQNIFEDSAVLKYFLFTERLCCTTMSYCCKQTNVVQEVRNKLIFLGTKPMNTSFWRCHNKTWRHRSKTAGLKVMVFSLKMISVKIYIDWCITLRLERIYCWP